MKFNLEKAVLIGAIAAASRAVTTRSSIPSLEGLLITAENGAVTLTGYNLATGIRATVEADVAKEGSAVINARLFGDIIRKMPDDMVTVSVAEDLTATIDCGMSHFNLLALPRADFPELPAVERDRTMTLPQATIKSMIGMTIFAVSDNENKPVHTGSLFDVKDGTLTVVSVDGYRMAIRRESVEATGDSFSFVVPGNALREVERLSADSDEPITLVLGRRHLIFEIGAVTLVSRLLEGEFLNYENAVPKDASVIVTADTRQIADAVERVSLVINERLKNPIRCHFEGGLMKLSCVTTLGRASDEVMLEGDRGEVEIGFNNRYLLDAVRAVPDERVKIELKTGLTPCIFRPLEGDAYLFMVLPVRLKNNEE
ncbi:DNA polymerase III subunit beta [Oscillospiraceae bacterium OttesenSCG-928-F05]|nr:DNA polymerase III subunit beta [Oscillospiraceae bacterium OttesenSCG-928-F05]